MKQEELPTLEELRERWEKEELEMDDERKSALKRMEKEARDWFTLLERNFPRLLFFIQNHQEALSEFNLMPTFQDLKEITTSQYIEIRKHPGRLP